MTFLNRVSISMPLLALCLACAAPADVGLRAPRPFEYRIRPTEGGDLFSFDDGATPQNYDSVAGHFKIWYVTATADHVPLSDTDDSGVPDYVEMVADRYDSVLAHLVSDLGYRAPLDDSVFGLSDDGGDSRFDVYLVDFAGMGDGVFGVDACEAGSDRCAGYMAQENDFAGYGYPSLDTAVKVLASHEFFHAVQAAYDSGQDTWWSEATATWAEESYDPSQRDFENFLSGYLNEPDRSLDVPPLGSVDAFSYGLAIWPQFLSEKYEVDLVRHIWEACENGALGVADPEALGAADRVLQAQYDSSFAQAFADFAEWNLHTGVFADEATYYADGGRYPVIANHWQGDLPLLGEGLRVYHASMQIFRARPGGRSQVSVGFVEEASADLKVGLLTETGPLRSAVTWIDTGAESPTSIDATGADAVLLLLVNTAMTGNSARPTLCLGSPEEVHTCRFGEGGGGDVDPGSEAPKPGCACAGRGSTGSQPWYLLLSLIGLGLRRRRSFLLCIQISLVERGA